MAPALMVVEDNDEDYDALVRAFDRIGEPVHIVRAPDGDAALDTLRNTAGRQLPSLVLLDLNLPGSDGRDILVELKATDHLRQLPIVIFSASADPGTIADCYREGASGYLVKPLEFERLERQMRALKEYWLDSVRLPAGR
jgi:CheY-like chemotaxis protein